MSILIDIDGYQVKVNLKQHSVHLVCNYALMDATSNSLAHIERLCKEVLEIHRQHFGHSLKIPIDSFVIEVLGHVYAYRVLLLVRKAADWSVFRKLSLNACHIDCGDSAHDNNRWFWDMFRFMKPVIFWFVSKKL